MFVFKLCEGYLEVLNIKFLISILDVVSRKKKLKLRLGINRKNWSLRGIFIRKGLFIVKIIVFVI